MKRIISVIVSLMMIVTMMPYMAFAEEADTTVSSGGQLQPTVQEEITLEIEQKELPKLRSGGTDLGEYHVSIDSAAAELREKMVLRDTDIQVKMKLDSFDGVSAIVSDMFAEAVKHTGVSNEGDYLKWSCSQYKCNISAFVSEDTYYATFNFGMTYYTSAEQEAEVTAAIAQLNSNLNLGDKTEYEKIKAIYDYMTANITYDYANLEDDSYKLKYTAYAALINKTSVCQGYATLFYRLALDNGLDARLIAGKSKNVFGGSEDHAWNIVKLGSKYYNIDSTWDTTWDSDRTSHDFFLKGSGDFDNHAPNSDYTTEEFKTTYPLDKEAYVVQEDDEPEVPGDDGNDDQQKPGDDDNDDQQEPGDDGNDDQQKPGDDGNDDQQEPGVHEHDVVIDEAKKATFGEAGNTEGKHCSACNEIIVPTVVIPAISVVELKEEKNIYTGKTIKPVVIVEDEAGNVLEENKDYTYNLRSGKKSIGIYTVTVTFTGDYEGEKDLTFMILPKAPASASISLYGHDDVKFSWSKSVGATGYYVYYKCSTDTNYKKVSTKNTYLKRSGLNDGVKYEFRVIPYYKMTGDKTAYLSPSYKSLSIYTLKQISRPTVTKKGTKVKVSWKNISGETGYQISQSTKSGKTKIVSTYKTTKGTYKTLTAKKGTKYYYRVRAYKQVGKTKVYGPWSSVKSYKR